MIINPLLEGGFSMAESRWCNEQRICTEVQNSKAEFIDCLRTRCQVYYDGKCHYKD